MISIPFLLGMKQVWQQPSSILVPLYIPSSCSKAGITELLFPQVSEFPLLKDIVALVTGETGVMPELPPEGVANPSDVLKYSKIK